MSIEELVRAELRSVAEQVEVPSLPSLEEPRRSWRVLVAVAAAVALVIGGLAFVLRDRDDPPPHPIEKPRVDHVGRTAPTIPWVDGDRLYVGGRQIPGHWLEVTSGGDTWLARRADGRVFWGQGNRRHSLGRTDFALPYDGPYLSPGGRYVAGGPGDDTLIDTATGSTTTVPLTGTADVEEWIAGVTDTGVVLSTRADGQVAQSYALRAGRPRELLRTQGGHLTRTTASGLLLTDARGNDWVVDVVGNQVRRVVQVSVREPTAIRESASLSSDRLWLLDLGWARDREEPRTLPVRAVSDGRPAPVRAPDGWVFAPQLAPGYWEPAGTLVTFVVRPENREYRAVRCAPATGECVLVEKP